jgi:ribosomal protein S12 methylthiotransferase accessory factor
MPLMGITRLANVTGLDRIGIPVYTAIRPNSRSLAASQGKGFDHDSAKASALMESIECWHAENIGSPLIRDSYLNLRGRAAVADITRIPLRANRTLNLNEARCWIEGWDMLGNRSSWVPYDSATMNMVFPIGYTPDFCVSSNGLSSGNHILEAIVHALCEVIERDADALWRADDRLAQLDLDTVTDDYCRFVIDHLRDAGIRLTVWDMTADTAIPAYICTIVEKPDRTNWRSLQPYFGAGCHLSPGIALMRAVTEAVQSRLTYISGSRDEFFYDDYELSEDWEYLEQVWEEAGSGTSIARFGDHADLATDSFEGDIEVLLGALRRVGIKSAVTVNLAKPEIGIPVVKVVVPGLEIGMGANCVPGERLQARRAA